MARMTFKAGEEYARKLMELEAGADEIARRAIFEGAKIAADAIKSNIPVDTGDLSASFGITPIKQGSAGDWDAHLGFDGYDSKGTPNQLKARAIESGTSKMQKRPFVRPAVNAVKGEVKATMERVIEEEINKLME